MLDIDDNHIEHELAICKILHLNEWQNNVIHSYDCTFTSRNGTWETSINRTDVYLIADAADQFLSLTHGVNEWDACQLKSCVRMIRLQSQIVCQRIADSNLLWKRDVTCFPCVFSSSKFNDFYLSVEDEHFFELIPNLFWQSFAQNDFPLQKETHSIFVLFRLKISICWNLERGNAFYRILASTAAVACHCQSDASHRGIKYINIAKVHPKIITASNGHIMNVKVKQRRLSAAKVWPAKSRKWTIKCGIAYPIIMSHNGMDIS